MRASNFHRLNRRERSHLIKGLLFISPWLVGLLAFTVYPFLYSIAISFTRYSGFLPPIWLGWQNYQRMFNDALVWQSLYNTFFYAVFAIPIGVIVAIILALAMNRQIYEVAVYRTALYLPSILPLFALSLVTLVLISPQYGLVSYVLTALGFPQIDYLSNQNTAKLVIVALAQLGAGNAALIFLAGLRAIPQTLYDAARIDGASRLRCFWSITLPMLSPVILYNVITGLSAALQVFQQAFIITGGGPVHGTLFFFYYLYNNAFAYAQLGYASALAVFLFVIGVVMALVLYAIAQRFVNYELVS